MFINKSKLFNEIRNAKLFNKYKPSTYTLDWGKVEQQGKRMGKMVIGGMSNVPQGEKTYISMLSGVPEYTTHREDFEMLISKHEQVLYLKAREYGLNHDQAFIYVIAETDTSISDTEVLGLLNESSDVSGA